MWMWLALLGVVRLGMAEVPREQSFDADWRFLRGDATGAEVPSLDDSQWRVLDVPHDWSIEDLPPKEGSRRVGPFDPDESHVISAKTQHTNCDYTLFEGKEVTGRVKKVFSRGDLIVDGDAWLGVPGRGQFVRRGETGGI